jgi:hypothetical protein
MENYQLVKQAKDRFRVAMNNMFPAIELENMTTIEALDQLTDAIEDYTQALAEKVIKEIKAGQQSLANLEDNERQCKN